MAGIDIGGFHAGVGGDGAGVSVNGHGVGLGWNGNDDNIEGNGGAGVSVNGHGAGFGVNGIGDDVENNAGVGWNAGSDHGGYVGESADGQARVPVGEGNHGGAAAGHAVAIDASGHGRFSAQQPATAPPAPLGGHQQASDQGEAAVGVGAGAGVGVGAKQPLAPLPNPGVGASCTVLGGPARLLYLPPGDAGRKHEPTPAIDATTPNEASVTPAPTGADLAPKDQPITAWANTFNPDYCYLSFSTLYATSSGVTIGPTFSNALIPFKTSEISTVCAAQPTGADGGRGAATQFNLAGLSTTGDEDTGCYHIVAPPRIGKFIPSWDNALYWNVSFEQPQIILPEGAADSQPEDCVVCAAPAFSPPAGTAYPTMVNEGYPKNYSPATETAPPGWSAASFGQFTATRSDLASPTITGSPTSPFGSIGSNVSTSSVSQYTGAAALTTASSGRVGMLVGLVSLLLALV
ncbi:hypothetical protein CLAFUW4_01825 [Fulvia fulva]|uniref:Uncharacterized protein n=1 Tax=Passalora fulva TaxID=5499 RepID=A0A9Q8P3W9_PASFU|nr:uncharacterized protein CLAFUR5_01820 [Fulvia fulva]KAK4634329.1 hypothetical protein CLAFUR4_01822 [Fulvia fulva]KAK4638134.1 hypothetical protein CLAFUR0_01824 [Fulvia fulva]UJO12254.1 hypothetical protein CLAFUR5_01820 [Fulvia fulva]WPV09957.1 hypothetical protein CLAFUW4_01825 [Fulvia fulva]WPV25357.1 hypothetical protein CLAFUW7_01826 [Fulvia fulva]